MATAGGVEDDLKPNAKIDPVRIISKLISASKLREVSTYAQLLADSVLDWAQREQSPWDIIKVQDDGPTLNVSPLLCPMFLRLVTNISASCLLHGVPSHGACRAVKTCLPGVGLALARPARARTAETVKAFMMTEKTRDNCRIV